MPGLALHRDLTGAQGSPGNPSGSCLAYHFRNILGGFYILKLNVSCCSLHSHSPRNSALVENSNKGELQEPPFPGAGTLCVCIALESFVASVFAGATPALYPLCVSAVLFWHSSASSSRLITQEVPKRFL